MPWNECKPMDERLRFIARLLEGEKMAPVCREFGISRVTGYKIFERYKACGLDGLHDRSRAPYRQANKLPFQVERAILGLKKEFPSWGAPKIRDKLIHDYPMIPPPAMSTIHAALDRNGLVKRRKRRRPRAVVRRCPPPTRPTDSGVPITRASSCSATSSTATRSPSPITAPATCSPAKASSPRSRSSPSPSLSARSASSASPPRSAPTMAPRSPRPGLVWLVPPRGLVAALRDPPERIKPGHPQQNGRHERMHLTLKNETTKPAAFNALQQQERFEEFIRVYNQERPHQALGGAYPAEVYTPSARPYEPPRDPEYPSTTAPCA